jgi:hypothetical protein
VNATRDAIGADGQRAAPQPAHERPPDGCAGTLRRVVTGLVALAALGLAALFVLAFGGEKVVFVNDSTATVTDVVISTSDRPAHRIDAVPAGGSATRRLWLSKFDVVAVQLVDGRGTRHGTEFEVNAPAVLDNHSTIVFDGESFQILAR